MQFGLISKHGLKKSPLMKLFQKVPQRTFFVRKEGTRWVLGPPTEHSYRFSLSTSVFNTEQYFLYSLIIETATRKASLRQVGNFNRPEQARLALNRGALHCRVYKNEKKHEPNTHVACPLHLNETCQLRLDKAVDFNEERKNGIEREYFLVHAGKFEFASTVWWAA